MQRKILPAEAIETIEQMTWSSVRGPDSIHRLNLLCQQIVRAKKNVAGFCRTMPRQRKSLSGRVRTQQWLCKNSRRPKQNERCFRSASSSSAGWIIYCRWLIERSRTRLPISARHARLQRTAVSQILDFLFSLTQQELQSFGW